MAKRKKYTESFKRQLVELVVHREPGVSIKSIADQYNIKEGLLYSWKNIYEDDLESVRAQRGETLEQEVSRLRKEILQLKQDNTVLKKSALLLLRDGR